VPLSALSRALLHAQRYRQLASIEAIRQRPFRSVRMRRSDDGSRLLCCALTIRFRESIELEQLGELVAELTIRKRRMV
jgi:hypothetical protein